MATPARIVMEAKWILLANSHGVEVADDPGCEGRVVLPAFRSKPDAAIANGVGGQLGRAGRFYVSS